MANEKRLIDANTLVAEIKETVCKNCNSHNGIRCGSCWVDDTIGFLQESPTVDAVEVVHGRWVRRIVDHEKPGYWKEECSICGFDGDAYAFLYCPSCGAKMDGDGNGNS